MIKSLRELNDSEIDQVIKYLNKVEDNDKSKEEILKELNNKMYNFGEGILFYFRDYEVVGSVKVVLEAVKHLSVIYIYCLTVDKKEKDKRIIVKELIEKGISIGIEKECKNINLGLNNEEILDIAKDLGYITSYSAYKMILKNRELSCEPLKLIKLTSNDKEEYLKTFNDSFSDMPHGCYYELSDVENYLKDDSNNEYYLVEDSRNIKCSSNIIGFMNIEIDNKIGSFDIGLCKKYRKLGYGRRLLETAIDCLNKRNVEKITLTVIEKNQVALNMYLKRGFEIESNLCRWIVIK